MEEIRTIDIQDKEYPRLLKEIKNPPKVLYIKGEILSDDSCFAIVGTRRCSLYGKQAALEFASDLSEAGLTIVSGLAPGIDTFCHQATLERNGRTIAVLGTGLDEKSIYPQSNLKLAEKIIEKGGAVLSEYPPGTRGAKFTFPQRNRIISGLSLGVLVIEAKERSGALITAEYASKQNRKVFALPGPIYSSTSRGSNFLIKEGAKLAASANDILRELNLPAGRQVFQKKIMAGTEEEIIILNILKEGALDVDGLIEKTNLPAAKISGILSVLEIKGKIRNLRGNTYSLSR